GGQPEHLGSREQPRGADPVGAAFVFLDLLEGQAERVGERLLVHPEQQAPRPDAGADMNIDRIRHAGAAAIGRRLTGTARFRQDPDLPAVDVLRSSIGRAAYTIFVTISCRRPDRPPAPVAARPADRPRPGSRVRAAGGSL